MFQLGMGIVLFFLMEGQKLQHYNNQIFKKTTECNPQQFLKFPFGCKICSSVIIKNIINLRAKEQLLYNIYKK